MCHSLEIRNPQRRVWLFVSLLAHCLVLYLWIIGSPIYVKTSSIAWGQHGKSVNLVYFPRASDIQPPQTKPRLRLKVTQKKAQERRESTTQAARIGIPTGSALEGPLDGTEAKPAIPLVFPDPPVYAWQLPKGLHGDVVVEVTIDEQGKVTETRLLESLAQEIDDQVIAAVRTWRFRPATVDGVAISSRQDVHFHFPS